MNAREARGIDTNIPLTRANKGYTKHANDTNTNSEWGTMLHFFIFIPIYLDVQPPGG